MNNDTPRGFFKPSRILRQVDSLSPYLFILMPENLSRMLTSEFVRGRIKWFGLPQGCPNLYRLFYAYDIMVFANGDRRCLRAISRVLTIYKVNSGQLVIRRSTLFSSLDGFLLVVGIVFCRRQDF